MKKWIYKKVLIAMQKDKSIKLTGKQHNQIDGLLFKCN